MGRRRRHGLAVQMFVGSWKSELWFICLVKTQKNMGFPLRFMCGKCMKIILKMVRRRARLGSRRTARAKGAFLLGALCVGWEQQEMKGLCNMFQISKNGHDADTVTYCLQSHNGCRNSKRVSEKIGMVLFFVHDCFFLLPTPLIQIEAHRNYNCNIDLGLDHPRSTGEAFSWCTCVSWPRQS